MKKKITEKQDSEPKSNKKKILVVDDHPVTRHGLSKAINEQPDLMVAGEAEDIPQAMEALKTLKPDMMIADISLKGSSGLELTKMVKKKYPAIPVLVQSMHDESMYGERALQAGALGYIMKDAPTENLIAAIRKVLAGQIYTSDAMSARLVNKMIHGRTTPNASPTDCLSNRELEVFNLIGQGLGTRQISDKLNLSVKTVETYRAHLKEKLELGDANELRQYAIQWVLSHNENKVVQD